MKNIIFPLLLLSAYVSNGQSAKWSLLFNTGINHGAPFRLQVHNELQSHFGLFNHTYFRTNSLYTFNPSLRYSKNKMAFECGIRNLGYTNNGNFTGELESSGQADVYINLNLGVYLGVNRNLVQFKDKLNINLGADIFYNYYVTNSLEIDHFQGSSYEETSYLEINEVGINLTPSANYSFSDKFALEMSFPINFLGWGNALATENIRENWVLTDYSNQRFRKFDFSNTYVIQLSLIINL
ncbi:MAG: hypothetical protein ACPGLV_06675 [Bacteroidia bacterium]